MYDDGRLMQYRRTFLRDNRPEEFERLTKNGELEAHLQQRADYCREDSKGGGLVAAAFRQWRAKEYRTQFEEPKPGSQHQDHYPIGRPWD